MDSLVKSVLGEEIETPKVLAVVCFKSDHAFFLKERAGTKPNTVRRIDSSDDRFILLEGRFSTFKANLIQLTDNQTHESFMAEITDYSEFEGWGIISFKNRRL